MQTALCGSDSGLPPQDGILDDAELNSFQMRCFNAPLQPEELRRVKQVVSEKLAGVRHAADIKSRIPSVAAQQKSIQSK